MIKIFLIFQYFLPLKYWSGKDLKCMLTLVGKMLMANTGYPPIISQISCYRKSKHVCIESYNCHYFNSEINVSITNSGTTEHDKPSDIMKSKGYSSIS